jgi:hypothetical protein
MHTSVQGYIEGGRSAQAASGFDSVADRATAVRDGNNAKLSSLEQPSSFAQLPFPAVPPVVAFVCTGIQALLKREDAAPSANAAARRTARPPRSANSPCCCPAGRP